MNFLKKILKNKNIHFISIVTFCVAVASWFFDYQTTNKIHKMQLKFQIEITKNSDYIHNSLEEINYKISRVHDIRYSKLQTKETFFQKHPIDISLGKKNIRAEVKL